MSRHDGRDAEAEAERPPPAPSLGVDAGSDGERMEACGADGCGWVVVGGRETARSHCFSISRSVRSGMGSTARGWRAGGTRRWVPAGRGPASQAVRRRGKAEERALASSGCDCGSELERVRRREKSQAGDPRERRGCRGVGKARGAGKGDREESDGDECLVVMVDLGIWPSWWRERVSRLDVEAVDPGRQRPKFCSSCYAFSE